MICARNIGLDWCIERWSKDRIDIPLAVDLPFPPTPHISVATAMRREGSRSAENLAKFVEVELPHVPEWASVLDQDQTQKEMEEPPPRPCAYVAQHTVYRP